MRCGKEFEALLIPQSPGTPECPSCHTSELELKLSLFAANSAERSAANWRAARREYKKTEFRDKKIAEAEAVRHHLDPD